MKNQIINILEKDGFVKIFSSFLAIIIGLLLGLIILLISNPKDALPAFITILAGGFSGGSRGMGQVIYTATPLILTGLSVGFAFQNRCISSDYKLSRSAYIKESVFESEPDR